MSDYHTLLARAVAAEKLAAERLEFAQQLHGQTQDLERQLSAAIETMKRISAERDTLKVAARGVYDWYYGRESSDSEACRAAFDRLKQALKGGQS
jgi:hypothetical protein